MSCRIKWYTDPDTNTHTQKSKTVRQTSQLSAMLMTWIRWWLWLDDRTSAKRIEGTRLCLPLHIMCCRVVGPFLPLLFCCFRLLLSLCCPTLWCVGSSSVLQLSPLHVTVRPGPAHAHFLLWVMVSEILMLRLKRTSRPCPAKSITPDRKLADNYRVKFRQCGSSNTGDIRH